MIVGARALTRTIATPPLGLAIGGGPCFLRQQALSEGRCRVACGSTARALPQRCGPCGRRRREWIALAPLFFVACHSEHAQSSQLSGVVECQFLVGLDEYR